MRPAYAIALVVGIQKLRTGYDYTRADLGDSDRAAYRVQLSCKINRQRVKITLDKRVIFTR